jgi:hypothetical protein
MKYIVGYILYGICKICDTTLLCHKCFLRQSSLPAFILRWRKTSPKFIFDRSPSFWLTGPAGVTFEATMPAHALCRRTRPVCKIDSRLASRQGFFSPVFVFARVCVFRLVCCACFCFAFLFSPVLFRLVLLFAWHYFLLFVLLSPFFCSPGLGNHRSTAGIISLEERPTGPLRWARVPATGI